MIQDVKTMCRRTTLLALATAMAGGRWWSQANAQEPAAVPEESLGQKIDRGLDKLGQELRQGWADVRASIDRMGVQGRVYGRLHWDKELSTATIDIEVREDKSVVLKGSVPSASARSKAVQLAQDTTGVHEVVDELGIAGK
jgi:hyperosmotically inducible protein